MTVLVTGGAGFIGTALVKRLAAEGEKVIAFDNCSRGSWKAYEATENTQLYVGDVTNETAVDHACDGIDEVIHLAYINGTKTFYSEPAKVLDVGVRGITNVLAACKKHGIKRFMLASSSEVCRTHVDGMDEKIPLVIPDPYNPRYSYSAGKIISEMMTIHSGLFNWYTIFRPFNIYGPDMHPGHVIPDFAKQLRERMEYTTEDPLPFYMLGSADETRSFCYIDDFIEGLLLIRKHGRHTGIYNIGTPEEITIGDLARRMANCFGRRLAITQAKELREGSILRRRPDISKLMALGFQPKVSLDEGLRKVLLCQ